MQDVAACRGWRMLSKNGTRRFNRPGATTGNQKKHKTLHVEWFSHAVTQLRPISGRTSRDQVHVSSRLACLRRLGGWNGRLENLPTCRRESRRYVARFFCWARREFHGLGRLWTRKKRVEELTLVAQVLVVAGPRFCQPLVVKFVLDWSW